MTVIRSGSFRAATVARPPPLPARCDGRRLSLGRDHGQRRSCRARHRSSRRSGRLLRGSTPFSGCCRPSSALTRKSAVSAMREKVDVGDGIDRQVAAGTEASDPCRRNERRARAIDLPPALGRHDEIVGRRKKLIDADIQQALQHLAGRLVVGDQGGVARRPAAPADPESPRSGRLRRPSNAGPEGRPTHDWPARPGHWPRTPRRS